LIRKQYGDIPESIFGSFDYKSLRPHPAERDADLEAQISDILLEFQTNRAVTIGYFDVHTGTRIIKLEDGKYETRIVPLEMTFTPTEHIDLEMDVIGFNPKDFEQYWDQCSLSFHVMCRNNVDFYEHSVFFEGLKKSNIGTKEADNYQRCFAECQQVDNRDWLLEHNIPWYHPDTFQKVVLAPISQVSVESVENHGGYNKVFPDYETAIHMMQRFIAMCARHSGFNNEDVVVGVRNEWSALYLSSNSFLRNHTEPPSHRISRLGRTSWFLGRKIPRVRTEHT